MAIQNNIKWSFGRNYCGKILYAHFSDNLKRKVTDYIAQFLVFDKIGTQFIPYISAWHEGKPGIWYEFASSKFNDIFGCNGVELPERFKKSIIDRIIYKMPDVHTNVTKEVFKKHQIRQARSVIREQSIKEGAVDAVYKILSPYNNMIWLKDQANIEIFPVDGICISRGLLVDVTKEMKAEEELKKAKGELQKHRDHLEEIVKDRTKRLWNSQLDIISRLARAAEFRDNRTGEHITKMSRYCAVLGKAVGLRKQANTILFLASPMHDVGKIGITDKILLKSGRLDSSEFEVMKAHCQIGAHILSGQNSDLLRVAKSIALSHHEKWDGSGYPHGIKKKRIPLAGRIASVCDVFDALTSDRPYKKAWSLERAVVEIHKGKGKHFDPELVDLFIKNLPEFRKIHHQQA